LSTKLKERLILHRRHAFCHSEKTFITLPKTRRVPFKDTEMSVRYRFTQAADSNTEGVEWVEAWDDTSVPPPSRKLSRVETFRGAWTFSRTSNNFSKATNSVKFDPKKMPLWLVEPMVAKFLVKGLEKIREMVAGER